MERVDERINGRISEEDDHCEMVEITGEICREAHIEHEVVDLVPGPAEDEAEGDESQSLDGVAPSLVPPVALGRLVWGTAGGASHLHGEEAGHAEEYGQGSCVWIPQDLTPRTMSLRSCTRNLYTVILKVRSN